MPRPGMWKRFLTATSICDVVGYTPAEYNRIFDGAGAPTLAKMGTRYAARKIIKSHWPILGSLGSRRVRHAEGWAKLPHPLRLIY